MDDPSGETADKAMMRRCIELSRIAASEGEYPFGSVVVLGGEIIAEATNRTIRDGDVTRHAEMIALSEAQKRLSKDELSRATLYSNIEPCAMCSYCIREAWVGRVVYSLSSPIMGGASKWNILRDKDISDRIPIFGPAPEVVQGIMLREVQQAWRSWNPLVWEMVRLRGVLTAPDAQGEGIKVLAADPRTLLNHLTFVFMRLAHIGSKWSKRA